MRLRLLLFAKLIRDRKGATAIEYGLIMALIAISALVGVMGLGNSTRNAWGSIENKYRTAAGG